MKEKVDIREIMERNEVYIPESTSKEKNVSAPGVCSIVRSEKNGKRFVFSKELNEQLGFPDFVKIALMKKSFIVGADLPEEYPCYKVNQNQKNGKGYLYNAGLVEELIDFYDLDFNGNKTTITLPKAKYYDYDGCTVARISVKYNQKQQ